MVGDGSDVIFASGGAAEDDTVHGGAGNDSIYCGLTISGGNGDDAIRTRALAQMITGDAGNDTITANRSEFGTEALCGRMAW